MRTLSGGLRDTLEATGPTDILVIFATIYHPSLLVPITVNTDIVDYNYNGHIHSGAAFEISFPSDDDSLPQAKVMVPNVDRRIGETILSITDAPRIKIELLVASDFDTSTPRQPIGTPTPEYVAPELYLRNIQCDAVQFTADIFGQDLTTEPWPKVRTTPEFTPSLFR